MTREGDTIWYAHDKTASLQLNWIRGPEPELPFCKNGMYVGVATTRGPELPGVLVFCKAFFSQLNNPTLEKAVVIQDDITAPMNDPRSIDYLGFHQFSGGIILHELLHLANRKPEFFRKLASSET